MTWEAIAAFVALGVTILLALASNLFWQVKTYMRFGQLVTVVESLRGEMANDRDEHGRLRDLVNRHEERIDRHDQQIATLTAYGSATDGTAGPVRIMQ